MAAQEKFDLVIRAKDEASVVLDRIQNKVLFLADGTVHKFKAVTEATEKTAIGFGRAELKAAALGSRLAGLSPAVAQVSQLFAFGNPVVAAAAFGIGLLTEAVFNSTNEMVEYAKTLTVTNEQLAKLAETTGLVGGKASFLKEQRLAALKAEEQALVTQIAGINTSKTIAQEYDRLGGITTEQTRTWNEQRIAADNLKIKLEGLSAQLATNREEQGKLTAEDEKAADATNKLAEATRKLIAAQNLRNIGGFGPITTNEQVDEARRLAEEKARQMELLASGNAFGSSLSEGPMSMIWEHEEEQHKQMVDAIKRQQDELAGYIESSAGRAMTGLLEVFMEGKMTLRDVWNGMAMDFYQYFIQQLVKMAGAKIAAALIGGAIGGPAGAAAGAVGGEIIGSAAGDYVVPTDVYGKRIVPTNAVQASAPIVVVTAPLSLTQDFVRKHVIPELKRLQMVGAA